MVALSHCRIVAFSSCTCANSIYGKEEWFYIYYILYLYIIFPYILIIARTPERLCDNATMRQCDAGDVSLIFGPHSRRPPEPIFSFFCGDARKIPHFFYAEAGGRRKIGTFFLRFCGFECQKRGKNRGVDVALRAKKSAFFGG